MALNKILLKKAIEDMVDALSSETDAKLAKHKFSTQLSDAIDAFVKSGTVTVASGIAVATAGTATAQTGTTTAPGTGTIL